ncbi:MAG: radical SAM protein [Anaerolineales bacterium]
MPNIDIVHNRVSVEIMRGCTRGCRFCHAGMITRPVRERPVDEVVEALEAAVQSSGFEEIALLSLSSSDYTNVLELVTKVGEKFGGKHLKVSLPSLRIESVSIDLVEKLRDKRSGGFTLAPEAATERMRRIINKFVPDEDVINTTREIYARGWTTIKLYFMIGHPSETLEDVQAIADLCKRVIAEGRKVAGMRVKLNAGVSTFVPKSQTPFQWVSCDTPEQIRAKQHCSAAIGARQKYQAESHRRGRFISRSVALARRQKNGGSRLLRVEERLEVRRVARGKNMTRGFPHSMSTDSIRCFTRTVSAARMRSSHGSTSQPRFARIFSFKISGNRSKGRSAWIADSIVSRAASFRPSRKCAAKTPAMCGSARR